MSDLTNASELLKQAALQAEDTTRFFDEVVTGDDGETVTNPNNGLVVPTVRKQISDLYTNDDVVAVAQAAKVSAEAAASEASDSATEAAESAAEAAATDIGEVVPRVDRLETAVYDVSVKPTLSANYAESKYTLYNHEDGYVHGNDLTDLFTVTRPTSATFKNAIGGISTAVSNRARMQWEEGVPQGYLSEESRANLLTNSEFPNGLSDAPSLGGAVSLSSMDLGNGAINALAFGAGSLSFARKTNYTCLAGTTYVMSVFVEMDDGLPPSFLSSSPTSVQNDFRLICGNVDGIPSEFTVSKFYGNVYRVSSVVTVNSSNTNNGVQRSSTNSPRTFKVTGFQLEEGAFPTSYIKTEGSQVTRAGDSMTRTLGEEWNPNEGTFVVEFDGIYNENQANLLIGNSGVYWLFKSESESLGFGVYDGSSFLYGGVPYTAGDPAKVSVSSDKDTMSVSVNGNEVVSGSTNGGLLDILSVTVPSTDTSQPLSKGVIKSISYYPKSLSSSELQELSRL